MKHLIWILIFSPLWAFGQFTPPTTDGALIPAVTIESYFADPSSNVGWDAAEWLSDLGVEAGADVTDTANVTAAGALMVTSVDLDIDSFSLPSNTTISATAKDLLDDSDLDTMRETLELQSPTGGGQLGSLTTATTGAAVGNGATATTGAALGASAIANGPGRVQLGTGTNSSDDTIQFLSSGSITAAQFGYLGDASRLYDGTPSQRQFFLDRLSSVRSGSVNHINVLQIGDSLAPYVSNNIFATHVQRWFPSPADVIGLVDGAGPQGGTDGGFYLGSPGGATTGTTFSKTEYDSIFIGSGVELDTGELVVYQYNGSFNSSADRLVIPILTEPGAGSVKIEIYDGAYRDPTAPEIVSSHTLTGGELIIDANAALGSDVVIIELASTTTTSVRISHESGNPVKTIPPGSQRTEDAAINVYQLFAGSNDFINETSTGATAASGLISAYEPHVITVHSDDGPLSYENFLPLLKSSIDDAALDYTPLVILIGSTPKQDSAYQAGQAKDLAAANAVMREYAAEYGWYFYDGFNIAQTPEMMVELGYEGDGIHPAGGHNSAFAKRIAETLGITEPVVLADTVESGQDVPTASALLTYLQGYVPQGQFAPNGITFGGSGSNAVVDHDGARLTNFTEFSLSWWGSISGKGTGAPNVFGTTRAVQSFSTGSIGISWSGSGFYVTNQSSSSVESKTSTHAVAADEEVFLTATVNTTTGAVVLYANGLEVLSESLTAPMVNTGAKDIRIMASIGGSSSNTTDTNGWLSGTVKFAALHDGILSASEAAELFDSRGKAVVGTEVFAYDFSEGVGYQLKDRSSNRFDAETSSSSITWLLPTKSGSLRADGINLTSGTGHILTTADSILPSNAVVTGYMFWDGSGAGSTGLYVERSDGSSTYEALASGVTLDADEAVYVSASGSQNLSLNNVRLVKTTGGTNVDVEVLYRVP